MRTTAMIDRTGRIYGRLTVVEYSHTKTRKSYWRCQCSCGETVTVRGEALASGNTRSCGCLHRETVSDMRSLKLEEGTTFGLLTVVGRSHRNDKQEAYWRCVCHCGALTEVSSAALTSGNTQSCGCNRGGTGRFQTHHA